MALFRGMQEYIALDVAVNTRTVLAIVPPQGCAAILGLSNDNPKPHWYEASVITKSDIGLRYLHKHLQLVIYFYILS